MTDYLSDCHNAPVKVVGGNEGTNHYECTKCGKSCNAQPKDTDSLEEIMPTITLVVDKTDVIVYANDTQLFKTPIDNEITLSSIPIHKDSQAALLKCRDDQLIAYQAELLADYEADVKNRVAEEVVAELKFQQRYFKGFPFQEFIDKYVADRIKQYKGE